MERFIEERFDPILRRNVKWVGNPVNTFENFADKWPTCQIKQDNFYRWIRQAKLDVSRIYEQKGMHNIKNVMSEAFGGREVERTFSNIGDSTRILRESGNMSMAAGTGIISSVGRSPIIHHNNFGKDE